MSQPHKHSAVWAINIGTNLSHPKSWGGLFTHTYCTYASTHPHTSQVYKQKRLWWSFSYQCLLTLYRSAVFIGRLCAWLW